MNTRYVLAVVSVVTMLTAGYSPCAAREVFQTPGNGANLGVWRIRHDPSVRDWANYHNTQCWSPDGRYLCYARYAPRDGLLSASGIEVHLVDLHTDEDRLLENGFNPRWAHQHNWLFYVRIVPGASRRSPALEVRWLDLETGQTSTLAAGVELLGSTSFDDRWLYGAKRFRDQVPETVAVRIPIRSGAVGEELPEVRGSQWQANPRHPVFFTRHDHRSDAFGGTRWFFDLDGTNRRMAVPTLQQCHMAWLGNGEYLLLGNGLIRGRKWNEPFPSDVHILAAVGVGDVSPCGRSGRYVCGDRTVADLRSGDGWHYLDPLSVICFPAAAGDQSGIFDADPKGSPDGTKVCFVTNYDLKDGPLTYVDGEHDERGNALRVGSTAGFPESGLLVVGAEVIGYQRKTATAFEGLTRTVYETARRSLRDGLAVTSFAARLLSDDQWRSGAVPSLMRRWMPADSPLLRQRQTDVHVAVVRKPDRPILLGSDKATLQIIPGEEHFETRGHHLLRDGRRITVEPLRPGAVRELEAGEYRAVAVEWSGLESDPSDAIVLGAAATVEVLAEPPEGFSWTRERRLVGEREVSVGEVGGAVEFVREVVHRYDGVVARQRYRDGVLVEHHDLNGGGKAIRRIVYEGGKPRSREYTSAEGRLVAREIFGSDGFLVETIRYAPLGEGAESDHWWFERGMPMRQQRGRQEWLKQGDRWVSAATGQATARERE